MVLKLDYCLQGNKPYLQIVTLVDLDLCFLKGKVYTLYFSSQATVTNSRVSVSVMSPVYINVKHLSCW